VNPLDNPIWEALTTRRSCFAEGNGLARRFHPEVTSLAGFAVPSEGAFETLAGLLADGEVAALFLAMRQEPPAGWQTVASMPLLQMVLPESRNVLPADQVAELGASEAAEMLALAKLTEPGPFGMRTHELGNYIGIRCEGRIVAMAGDRLRVEGYTEISAVCTEPGYLGRGFAAGLIGALVERIRARGETPMLHVRGNNARAIELYKRLGFKTRAQLHALVLRRTGPRPH
jgi:GNAT superfamily N-acetyltransferase